MSTALTSRVPASRWLRILPAVILIYIVASLDKSNVSYAIAGGMDKDLGLSATFAGLVAGIFFIGYLFLQVPGAMLAEKKNAKAYIAWTVIAFGSISILSAFAQNDWQMLLARFLFGVAEGGLFPAILVLISRWFPNKERGRANGFFLMNSAIAGVVGGPLAGWLLPLFGWRGLFVAEGLLAFAMIAIFLPFLDSNPATSMKISAAERDYIVTTIERETSAIPVVQDRGALKAAFTDVNTLKLIIIYFCMQVGIYGFSMWLPTTIEQLVHSGAAGAAFLSTVPNLMSIIGCFALAAWSDRHGNRRLWTAIGLVGFAVFLIGASLLGQSPWIAFAFLVACGFFLHGPSGVFWAMPPMVSDPGKAAPQRGVINALGNIGGFVGPFFVGWLTDVSSSTVAFYSLTVFTFIGIVVTLTMPAVTAGARASRAKADAVVSQAK